MRNTLKFLLISTICCTMMLFSNAYSANYQIPNSNCTDYIANKTNNNKEKEYKQLVKDVLQYVDNNLNDITNIEPKQEAYNPVFANEEQHKLCERIKNFTGSVSIQKFLMRLDSASLTDKEFMTRMSGIILNNRIMFIKNGPICVPGVCSFLKAESERYNKLLHEEN